MRCPRCHTLCSEPDLKGSEVVYDQMRLVYRVGEELKRRGELDEASCNLAEPVYYRREKRGRVCSACELELRRKR